MQIIFKRVKYYQSFVQKNIFTSPAHSALNAPDHNPEWEEKEHEKKSQGLGS